MNATPRPLYPRERPGIHNTGGWLGRRVGLDGCGKSRLYPHSNPGPSSPYRVAIPTELSGSQTKGKGRPITGRESRGGVEVWLYYFFNFGDRGLGWLSPCPGRFTPRKDPVPIV